LILRKSRNVATDVKVISSITSERPAKISPFGSAALVEGLLSGWVEILSVSSLLVIHPSEYEVAAPVIHGKGRIMFTHFEIAIVDIDMLREIPDGPQKDADFIAEGTLALLNFPQHGFPYIIAVWDSEEECYWIIEGRHRKASYLAVGTDRLTILVGRGMIVLDTV
jgi:hypothetical protein